jgi:hypothetical protein
MVTLLAVGGAAGEEEGAAVVETVAFRLTSNR